MKDIYVPLVFMLLLFSSLTKAITETKNIEPANNKLDFVVLKVNDQRRIVPNGKETILVRGDQLLVERALLENSTEQIETINVVGFDNKKAPHQGEDRGFLIDTSKDLLRNWSENKHGIVYKITAKTRKKLHGQVYIRFVEPSLKYVIIRINGKAYTLKDDEIMKIKESDKIKVEDVVTNLQDNGHIRFQLIPFKKESPAGFNGYELRFSHNEKVFAKIPLQMEG